jgi:cytochrome c5
MKRFAPLSVLALTVALAACGEASEPEVINTNPDPMANMIANAAPVELPPAVKDSVIYRCKDNSIVYVDFLSDDKSANIRTEKGGTPTLVTAAEAGQPMTADGYSISGAGEAVEIAVKGGAAQSCHS